MKKSVSALLLSLLCISPGSVAAMKAGIGLDMGLSAVFQFNDMLNLAVGNDGVAVDLLASRGASGAIGWYVGLGGWKEWGDENDDVGLRIPVGLELDFTSGWDVYAQVHPELRFEDDNGRGNDDEVKLGVGFALGFRYLF